MFEEYKNRIGYYIFKKKIFKEFNSSYSFNDFIENSSSYVIIMPLNDIDFANSFDIAKYFKIHKKEVTLFLPEHRVNSENIISNYKYLSYDLTDITKFGLPSKLFIKNLNENNFDVLIDLERDNNLFLTSIASLINAKYKVGFKKPDIENLYNFQLVSTKINSEISYRNLLNSLKMF
ncbi:MAG: hypothetical protein KDC88_00245 [Ignavibacteriae bacterium]|nr:hypothetical protein [Ignavibacteriota bacterium]MCB9210157.1 hypothetical protein [Ignavibacteriales bacterium]MCB9218458.1 hypothetical protein [Ignavibacteriales bacterium]MCB9259536.1 hypothetical protein [Ignavibacteriales bacterium]